MRYLRCWFQSISLCFMQQYSFLSSILLIYYIKWVFYDCTNIVSIHYVQVGNTLVSKSNEFLSLLCS